MKIDQAIGILEEEGAIAKLHKATGKVEALLLGVEALDRVKELRDNTSAFDTFHRSGDLLPSESE